MQHSVLSRFSNIAIGKGRVSYRRCAHVKSFYNYSRPIAKLNNISNLERLINVKCFNCNSLTLRQTKFLIVSLKALSCLSSNLKQSIHQIITVIFTFRFGSRSTKFDSQIIHVLNLF